MKLYTEEQVRKVLHPDLFDLILPQMTPIELPSDEEIMKQSYRWIFASRVWEQGARWMKEQILDQNKTRVFGEVDDKQFWNDKPNQNK